jgi:uncharacterized membrane protein
VVGISIGGAIAMSVVLPAARQLVAAVLILLLTGYAVSLALLPIREVRLSELLTVVLAAGAASLAVGGMLLTGLPVGVSTEAWVGLVALLVAAGLVVAAFRRRPLLPNHVAGQLPWTTVLATLIALGAAGGALAIARAGAEQGDRLQTFAELWAIPSADRMLHIGLTSHEKDSNTYRVDVELDSKIIAHWEGISLAPGAEWETVLVAPSVHHGTAVQILAFLGGDVTPYRSVILHSPMQ